MNKSIVLADKMFWLQLERKKKIPLWYKRVYIVYLVSLNKSKIFYPPARHICKKQKSVSAMRYVPPYDWLSQTSLQSRSGSCSCQSSTKPRPANAFFFPLFSILLLFSKCFNQPIWTYQAKLPTQKKQSDAAAVRLYITMKMESKKALDDRKVELENWQIQIFVFAYNFFSWHFGNWFCLFRENSNREDISSSEKWTQSDKLFRCTIGLALSDEMLKHFRRMNCTKEPFDSINSVFSDMCS